MHQISISVSVMSHRKRKAQAQALAKQLKQYPFIDVSITWDTANEEWHTGKRAMQRGIGRGDWHLVVQDDAILTPYIYTNIQGCVNSVPTKAVISLYTGRVKPLPDRVTDAVRKAGNGSWLNFYMLLWGVAILIPSDHIEPMLDFINEPRYEDSPYDNRIGMFYQRNRLPIYYTVPSLVDHNDDLGTLLPGHATKAPRIAHRLATGPVVWNSHVIDI